MNAVTSGNLIISSDLNISEIQEFDIKILTMLGAIQTEEKNVNEKTAIEVTASSYFCPVLVEEDCLAGKPGPGQREIVGMALKEVRLTNETVGQI